MKRLAANLIVFFSIFFVLTGISFAVVAPSSFVSLDSFVSSSSVSFSLSSVDAISFDTGYFSVDGGGWQSFDLVGDRLDDDWLSGSSSGSITVDRLSVDQSVYVIVFTCSLVNGAWDCHGGDWQLLEGVVPAVNSDPPVVDGSAWSDPSTWSSMGMSVPLQGDVVTIPSGERVVLDVSPPSLDGILVHGTLEFAHTDLAVTTDFIKVMGEGAELIIGTEAEPFTGDVVITLTGSEQEVLDAESNGDHCGSKVICSMGGGSLEMISDYSGPSWTRLRDGFTAAVGDTSITLEESVGWDVGDEIVIVSTDYDPGQAEKRIITQVSGNTISFAQPLEFMHYGQLYCKEGYCIDMRAEIMHLTRSIRIQGDADSTNTQLGGHIMAMNEHHMIQENLRKNQGREYVDLWQEFDNDLALAPKLDGVELYRMGQQGILARYPWHWHLYGDASGSYVKNSVVHDSFQRCFTIHGTQNALLEANVAFNAVGHCYFLEDGAEWDNVLRRNVGAVIRNFPDESKRLIVSDDRPSVFWWSNHDNVFTENVAAGAFGFGFWLDSKKHPDGPSATQTLNIDQPDRDEAGTYLNNVAHSTVFTNFEPANDNTAGPGGGNWRTRKLGGVGFMVGERNPERVGGNKPGGPKCGRMGRPDETHCDFVGTIIYKNNMAGFFRSDDFRVRPVGNIVADNDFGLYTHRSYEKDNVLFAYTDNVGTPGSWGAGMVPLVDDDVFVGVDHNNNQYGFEDFNSKELEMGRSMHPDNRVLDRERITSWGFDWQYDGGKSLNHVFINYHDDEFYDRGAVIQPGNSHLVVMFENTLIDSEPYLPSERPIFAVIVAHDGTFGGGQGGYGEIRSWHEDFETPRTPNFAFDETCTPSSSGDHRYVLCSGQSFITHVDLGGSAAIVEEVKSGKVGPLRGGAIPAFSTYVVQDFGSNRVLQSSGGGSSARSTWINIAIPTDTPFARSGQTIQNYRLSDQEFGAYDTAEQYCSSNAYVSVYYDPELEMQYVKFRGTTGEWLEVWNDEEFKRNGPWAYTPTTLDNFGSADGYVPHGELITCK